MSRNIGLFVDISDLYIKVRRRYKNQRRLDFRKYYSFVEDLGGIQLAIAYGCQRGVEANGFKFLLSKIGFEPKFQNIGPNPNRDGPIRADWSVQMALDVAGNTPHFNTLVLGSSHKSLLPVVQWAKQRGLMVIILASGISPTMQRAANHSIEIPESLLCSNSEES